MTTRAHPVLGIALIVVGALLASLLILAAFTPIGLMAAPVGAALIAWGSLLLSRS